MSTLAEINRVLEDLRRAQVVWMVPEGWEPPTDEIAAMIESANITVLRHPYLRSDTIIRTTVGKMEAMERVSLAM
ncbi:MAG: hypothetical protein KGR26_00380 [Cyanobacteria bacterium REEB65]|nr:hypothetical protein [Cyanobacteria bacterium REEB65]